MASYPFTSRMGKRLPERTTRQEDYTTICNGCEQKVTNDQCGCCTICGTSSFDVDACDQILRLNVYRAHREYGGPEEGGWYRTVYHPLTSIVIGSAEEGVKLMMELEPKYKELFADDPGDYGYWIVSKQECRVAHHHANPLHYE